MKAIKQEQASLKVTAEIPLFLPLALGIIIGILLLILWRVW